MNSPSLPIATGLSFPRRLLLFAGCFALLASCSLPILAAPHPVRVTATTTMITDLVQQIGGDQVEVQGLMGPGVDPHLYKPTASDVIKLQKADIIFYNGLLLEGKLTDLFARMARTQKHVYAVTESIPTELFLEPPEFQGHYDPHVWLDVSLWSGCVEVVVQGLSAVRPESADLFTSRGVAVKKTMTALHDWALKKSAELPPEKRILVTSHDAYNYFGRAYGFKVVGLQGVSTVTEAGLADMAKMVDFIRKHKVRAIFAESSVSAAAIRRISSDSGAMMGGELFSDAMGTPGEMENGYDLGTYEGMIRHNLETIVRGLKGS